MTKRIIAFMLIAVLALGVAACTPSKPAETGGEEPAETAEEKWKIGIMTNTVVQNEEEYRAAQNILKSTGKSM